MHYHMARNYRLITSSLIQSALNFEVYNTFSTIGSDHRILLAKLRLSLRQSKSSSNKKVRYDWSKLLTGNSIKELYTVEVNNRFPALQNLEENVKNSNTIYTNTISAHEDVATKYVPVQNKVKQHVQWLNDDIVEKRKAILEALDYCNHVKTRSSVKKLEDAKILEAYFKEQEDYAQGKMVKIIAAADHQKSKIVWETVIEFTGRKETNKSRIKAESPEEQIKKWKDHILNLLGQPPVTRSKETKTVFNTHCKLTLTTSPWKS